MKKTKRTLALVLSFVMAVSGVELPSFATKQNDAEVVLGQQENKQSVTDVFGDISDTVWYLDAVQFVYDKGLMTGSEGMFWPEKSVSRAMLVTTLYRMEGSPVVENDSAMERFEDVKADKWYTDAICWAYENEITTGNPNMDTFGVDTPVTREQLTTFFYRFAQYKELDTAQIGDLSTLLNVDQMETYAEESVVWAVGTGLINGTRSTDENGEFVYDLAPKADTTRAQLAVILQRFCEEYALFAEEELPEVTPEVTEEATPEETPEVTEEALPEATPEVTEEALPEATPEVTEGETPEVTPEVTEGETAEVTPEVTEGETPEVTPEEEDEIIADLGGVTDEAAMARSESPRYFPVTMYNYDKDGMNAITRQMEAERHLSNLGALDEWKGLYFIDESPKQASFDYSDYVNQKPGYRKVTDFKEGKQYVLVSAFVDSSNSSIHHYGVSSYAAADGRFNPTTSQIDVNKNILEETEIYNATIWQCDKEGHLYFEDNGVKKYINLACNETACKNDHDASLTTDVREAAKLVKSDTEEGIFFVKDQCITKTQYLNIVDNRDDNQFGGYYDDDAGSKFYLYQSGVPNLEDPRMSLFYRYVKETTSQIPQNESFILVSNYDYNGRYSIGYEQLNADGTSAGRLTGGQSITETIEENQVAENTIIWQCDAEGYIYYMQDDVPYYINIIDCLPNEGHSREHSVEITTTKNGSIKIEAVNGEAGVFKLYDENACQSSGCYFDMLNKPNHLFGGWPELGSGGKFSVYKKEVSAQTPALDIADYNYWLEQVAWNPEELDSPTGGKLSLKNSIGEDPSESESYIRGTKANRLYGGMVADRLDENGDIQFNMVEPGMFTLEEHEAKQVYTNVELPFEYDYTTGDYVFDSAKMSARFSDGKGADNATLQYSQTAQRAFKDEDATYPDGSKTVWMPYNDTDNLQAKDVVSDYHFGMVFNIPFFMTADGRLPSGQRYPIEFEFSGDDDIWIFVDGYLVLDMGGVHNNISGKINFADNTWQIYKDDTLNSVDMDPIYVDGSPVSGNVFATAEQSGVIPMTREAFAEEQVHTLTMFYMERGAGSANNKIKFNLLVRDSLNVMKEINEVDANQDKLSKDMLEYLNQRDFEFRLTNNGDPVKNRNYYLMDIRGMYLQTLQTNEKGEFTLKNGQTAKFSGPLNGINTDTNHPGDHFVVEELKDPDETAWLEPDWHYTSRLGAPVIITDENGKEVEDPRYEEKSGEVKGDCESPTIAVEESYASYMEMVNIRCTNTLNLKNEPEINDDKVVIDYGIPVEIDIFANDIVPSNVFVDYDNISLSAGGIGKFGNAVYDSVSRRVVYTLGKQMTAAEKITYTVPYTVLHADGSSVSASEEASIWIMPATTMYYEEDFGLVSYTGKWKPQGEAVNFFQEPGVVGSVSDSTYGSDAAYLDDAFDSNDTSMYVKTTETEGAGFTYTFTGKGTTFFARTTSNSGYMKVEIECLDSNQTVTYVDQWLRDTRFNSEDGKAVLYNIPVFSWSAEEYGTYRVTVSLAKLVYTKSGKQIYGTEFWLDGIRILEPLDTDSEYAGEVKTAYAGDGEANVDIVTLRNKLIQSKMEYDQTTGKYIWSPEDQANDRFVVFTDEKGEISTAEDYISKGPKEEVYLKEGQSISFELAGWDPNGAKVYLGIKAPMGAGTVLINGNPITIGNSVDGYYDISVYRDMVTEGNEISEGTGTQTTNPKKSAKFVITAGEGSLISLTNIKATGGTKYTIISDFIASEDNTNNNLGVNNVDIYIEGYEGADPLPPQE